MDIRVGAASDVGAPADSAGPRTGSVEARVLGIRAPRRKTNGPAPRNAERRRPTTGRDPVNGRVLILMIPDGSRLPADIETGDYRVILRFARR